MKFVKIAAMLLAGVGILFSSCNKEIENQTNSVVWGDEIRAELSEVCGEPQTRAHNVYMYEVRWDEGDQIYVKDAGGQHAKFTLVDGENTTKGVFRQNDDETTSLSGAIEAFYPAGLGETMIWPATMTEGDAMPMYCTKEARSGGDESLIFKSLGSVVNLVFNSQTQGATLQSITLSADQPLSGAFTVNAEGKAVLSDNTDGTVTLDFGAQGKALTSPASYSFYLYVPEGEYTNLTATFNAIGRKPYVCNFGTKILHHNSVEKFSVAGQLLVSTVTGDATHITCRSAEISGMAGIQKGKTTDVSYGILYSTSSDDVLIDSATRIEAESLDAENNYSVEVDALVPETVYYYRSYTIQGGKVNYGEIKSFNTLAVNSMIQTLDVTEINSNEATLNAYLDLSDCRYDALEYGFEITPEGGVTNIVKSDNYSEKKYFLRDNSLSRYTKYSVVAYVRLDGQTYKGETKVFKTLEIPELVDLGLSVKWSSWNLGATKPEDYGDYYQWAGTADVTDERIYLDWDNCPYHTGSGYSSGWTKYVPSDKSSYWSGSGSPDGKTFLDPEDDVVRVKMGGKWRMPTKAEWDELVNNNNCSWTWTSINGVNGYRVQSRKPGYTDNWIFLPAAGYRMDDRSYMVGDGGDYWSSSLETDFPEYSCGLYFSWYYMETGSSYRCDGQSVRPVSE